MSLKFQVFPFSAFSGNELAKTAVLCALVNDRIKGIIINGSSGTGKTTLVRSISNISGDRHLVNIPFSVNDESLYGNIDLEKAVSTGEITTEDGLLARANRNLVEVDDIDLMDKRTLLTMMNAVDSGYFRIGNGDLSREHPVDTKVFATTCKKKQFLDPHVLDRFDICTTLHRPENGDSVRLELAFADCDDGIIGPYLDKDREVAEMVRDARKLLPRIRLTDAQDESISRICSEYGIEGYRGGTSCAEVAISMAALNNRTEVCNDDILTAVVLTLEFRRTKFPEVKKQDTGRFNSIIPPWMDIWKGTHHLKKEEAPKDETPKEIPKSKIDPENTEFVLSQSDDDDPIYLMTKVGEMFKTIDLLESEDNNGIAGNKSQLKRTVETPFGKYSGSRIPEEDHCDIALDATIRAAAPHQKARRSDSGMKVVIKKDDVREKIKTERLKTTFLFVLDSSGSLLIRNRIKAVKTTVVSMLENHYARRDRVGLITFNDTKIEVAMEPSRATSELSKTIENVAIGPGTPLSGVFQKVYDYLEPYTRHHPNEICHVVLLTDGRASTSLDPSKDPNEEALEIARTMRIHNTDWIVIDTGFEYTRCDNPRKLAEALEGRFFMLDDLKTNEDTKSVW